MDKCCLVDPSLGNLHHYVFFNVVIVESLGRDYLAQWWSCSLLCCSDDGVLSEEVE